MSKQGETNNKSVNDKLKDLPDWKKDQYKAVMSESEKESLGIETEANTPEIQNPLDYDHNPIAQENAMLRFDGKQVPPDQSPESVPEWKQHKWDVAHGNAKEEVEITREVLPVSSDIILNADGTVANVPENIGKIAPVGRVLVVGDRTHNNVLDPAKSPYNPNAQPPTNVPNVTSTDFAPRRKKKDAKK